MTTKRQAFCETWEPLEGKAVTPHWQYRRNNALAVVFLGAGNVAALSIAPMKFPDRVPIIYGLVYGLLTIGLVYVIASLRAQGRWKDALSLHFGIRRDATKFPWGGCSPKKFAEWTAKQHPHDGPIDLQ